MNPHDEQSKRPHECRLFQRAKEHFQKREVHQTAATHFARVAENYVRDGYVLKNVAIYRQVVKLDPGLIDLLPRIASLHAELELEEESNEHLLKAVAIELQLSERNVTFTPRVIARA